MERSCNCSSQKGVSLTKFRLPGKLVDFIEMETIDPNFIPVRKSLAKEMSNLWSKSSEKEIDSVSTLLYFLYSLEKLDDVKDRKEILRRERIGDLVTEIKNVMENEKSYDATPENIIDVYLPSFIFEGDFNHSEECLGQKIAEPIECFPNRENLIILREVCVATGTINILRLVMFSLIISLKNSLIALPKNNPNETIYNCFLKFVLNYKVKIDLF